MIRVASALLCAGVAATAMVHAQAAPSRDASSSHAALFVGYSYLFRNYVHTQLNPATGGMSGWDAAISVPAFLRGHIGVVGDFSGHYQTSGYFTPQIYFLALGPEFSTGVGRSRVYAHGLFGTMFATTDVIAQTASRTVPLYGAGGGLDDPISSRLSWRVNFDWMIDGFDTKDYNQISQIVNNNPRISTGPVLRF